MREKTKKRNQRENKATTVPKTNVIYKQSRIYELQEQSSLRPYQMKTVSWHGKATEIYKHGTVHQMQEPEAQPLPFL